MKRRAAFTLAELLVALALTSILVVLLASLVSAAVGTWQQGRNRLATFSTARQQLARISDEITGALAAVDRIEFVENDSGLADDTEPDTRPVVGRSENLFFVAPHPNDGAGDLCVIAYRHNRSNATLERAFKNSAAAWGVEANRYKISGYSSELEWRKVADGVIEFEIQSYAQDAADPEATWDSTATSGIMRGRTPRRIGLRMKTVDDKTLARLNSLPVGSPARAELIARAARDFTAVTTLPPR